MTKHSINVARTVCYFGQCTCNTLARSCNGYTSFAVITTRYHLTHIRHFYGYLMSPGTARCTQVSCKVPDFNQMWIFFRQISIKALSIKFHGILCSGSRSDTLGRTDVAIFWNENRNVRRGLAVTLYIARWVKRFCFWLYSGGMQFTSLWGQKLN